jgi:hypothetical protein
MPPHRKENLDAIGFSWYDDMQKEEEQRWEENYQKLLQFKKTNGHLIVPNNDSYHKLHTWVTRQRRDEKIISVIHKKRLNAIEFRWKRNIKKEQAIGWDNKFEELKAFYEKHGHCQVPNHSKEFSQLGVWVQRHRRLWDKLDKKKRNKLEELNFVTSSAIEKKSRQHWINMLAKLKKFKNEFGHCRVPSYYKPNLTLGSWVEFQRLLEHKLEGWKKRHLIALGFEWSSDIRNEKLKRWDEMYRKLVKFYERFGHSSVPEGWNEDPKLAIWVSYLRHPKKPHSVERKDLLKQVKFEFKPKPHHRKRDEKGHFITSTKSL